MDIIARSFLHSTNKTITMLTMTCNDRQFSFGWAINGLELLRRLITYTCTMELLQFAGL